MADLLVDVATYLDAQTAWTTGTDLFIGDMPNAPDALTVLYETGGSPPLETVGADAQPAVIHPRVQVLTRATTYPVARARARLAYQALTLVTNESVNGAYYHRIAPVQEPFLLSRDDSERVLFACNYDVLRVAE